MFNGQIAVNQIPNVGDTAAYGFGALGFEFLGINIQGCLNMIQIKVKHERSMTEHTSAGGELGITRDFLFPDLQIVATGQLGIHTKLLQSFHDRLGELAEVVEGLSVILGNKTEIEVAQIMVDCAPPERRRTTCTPLS